MHVHISEKSDIIRGHFYRPVYNVDANGETQSENADDHCREKIRLGLRDFREKELKVRMFSPDSTRL